ncbi:MAG: hypothetical protein KKE12_01780 [Proteobacteria bacterium]|nr:hypothetical protein [Pseudomonadota bacterium]
MAEEKLNNRFSLIQLINTVCLIYEIEPEVFALPGKKQPSASARAVAAYFVQEEEYLSLTDLGNFAHRDLAALSRAAGRIRERIIDDFDLADKVALTREQLLRITKCQA